MGDVAQQHIGSNNQSNAAKPGMHLYRPVYNNGDGGGNMDDKYVSKDYLNARLDTINQKIDGLNQHIDDGFNSLGKQIPLEINNAILNERQYQQAQQKENRRFFWGTIIIGGIAALAGIGSLVVAIITFFK